MEIAELFKAMQEGFTKLENGQTDMKIQLKEVKEELKEVKQRLGKVEIIQETMQKDIKILLEGQESHNEQNNRSFKNIDTLAAENIELVHGALKNISKDTKEIKESIEVLEEMTGKHEVKIRILERRPV